MATCTDPISPPDPTIYTPPRLAAKLGVAIERVRAWILSGELETIDLRMTRGGKRPRHGITEEAVQDFLRRRKNARAPKIERRPVKSKEQYERRYPE